MKLYEHQKDVLKQTQNFNRVGYFLDMGLGKTFVGSEKMAQLNEKVNLLICQKSKIQDWINHFNMYYEGYKVVDLTKKNSINEFIQSTNYTVGIVNYELAWRRKALLTLSNFTLMLDESSLIQNRKAKQSKFILKLQPKNVILLSGTPCSGKYENLWSQVHLLGWEISEDIYNKQYVNWRRLDSDVFKHKIVDKENPYKNIERLKNKMRKHGAVFLKTEQCFSLPTQNFIDVEVDNVKGYSKFKKSGYLMFDTLNHREFIDKSDFFGDDITPRVELVGDTLLTKMLYERMLCGQYNDNKIQALSDLLIATQDRLIIFYNFNAELEQIKKLCEKLNKPVSTVNGHERDLTAYENEDNSVTLCQYQAASKGLNLQFANKIIYFTPTLKCEDYMQSQKRIHRIGQERPCFYYRLICKKSVEEQIYHALQNGVDYTDKLFKKGD